MLKPIYHRIQTKIPKREITPKLILTNINKNAAIRLIHKYRTSQDVYKKTGHK